MPTQHPHAAAQTLAGEVFGKILHREADAGGYAYVLDCLESGQKSLQEIVVEFMTSDEFIERFASSLLPAQSVDLVHRLLLGRSLDRETELLPAMRELVRLGLTAYVEKIAASEDYANLVGPDGVPGFGHFGADAADASGYAPPMRQRRPRRAPAGHVGVEAELRNSARG
jgi:hypothetical protein